MKLLLFTLLLNLNALASTDKFENCHYYLDLEKKRGCWFSQKNESDYLVRYGYKYCSTFEREKEKLTKQGQKWVDDTRECLQIKLEQNQAKLNCKQMEDMAFKSHSKCYIDSGFCSLKAKDKTKIIFIATQLDVFLKFKKSARQAIDVLKDCFY